MSLGVKLRRMCPSTSSPHAHPFLLHSQQVMLLSTLLRLTLGVRVCRNSSASAICSAQRSASRSLYASQSCTQTTKQPSQLLHGL